MRWNDFDHSKGVPASDSWSRRSFGVMYLKAAIVSHVHDVFDQRLPRCSFSPYPFQPLVVNLSGVSLTTAPVCHWLMDTRNSGGKSEPQSMTQPTVFENGGGENTRAPSAEYEPAPPTISLTGGFGGANSISSDRIEHRLLSVLSNLHTNYKHPQCTKFYLCIVVRHADGQVYLKRR
jgi:hypothetical protein